MFVVGVLSPTTLHRGETAPYPRHIPGYYGRDGSSIENITERTPICHWRTCSPSLRPTQQPPPILCATGLVDMGRGGCGRECLAVGIKYARMSAVAEKIVCEQQPGTQSRGTVTGATGNSHGGAPEADLCMGNDSVPVRLRCP